MTIELCEERYGIYLACFSGRKGLDQFTRGQKRAVAKCSANRHSSPFSTATTESVSISSVEQGALCNSERSLARCATGTEHTVVAYRVLVKYLRCIPTLRQRAGEKMREKEKLAREQWKKHYYDVGQFFFINNFFL